MVAVAQTARGSEDEDVIRLTVREKRILLTEDRDFGRLVFAQGAESLGVVYIRFPVSARSRLGQSVVGLVNRLGERLQGKFIVLQPGRARIAE